MKPAGNAADLPGIFSLAGVLRAVSPKGSGFRLGGAGSGGPRPGLGQVFVQ
jgi:hypothetical protein